jgi:hypothetical protein
MLTSRLGGSVRPLESILKCSSVGLSDVSVSPIE